MISPILSLIAIFLAIVLHEIAHGYMAYILGDNTAKIEKRLTLNPINHIDPIGTFVVPLSLFIANVGFMFGWAKPVPVDYRNLKNFKRDIILVASAGIITNLILALISIFTIKLLSSIQHIEVVKIILEFLMMFTMSNIVLAVFNILPIPPLDGSKMLFAWIEKPWAYRYLSNERLGFGIIIFAGFIIPSILSRFGIDFDILGIYIRESTRFIINLFI